VVTRVLLVVASVVVVILIVGAIFVLKGGAVKMNSTGSTNSPSPSESASTGAGKLVVTDQVIGTGAEAKADSTVSAKYTGKLDDGTVFDSTDKHGGDPIEFPLSGVIKGWQQGIPGMKVGGKRTLVIPPELGYGSQGTGGIPPNATLTFEIELMGVK
jgi:FKBP-type peptidyl-prolyl cis-trans isomerase